METSELLKYRAAEVVPQRIEAMEKAIAEKDFHSFAQITMQDSNQFHAICQDTYPPIRYMNQLSWDIVSLVHKYNTKHDSNKLAYTFDAGPNAFLFCLEENTSEILKVGVSQGDAFDSSDSSKKIPSVKYPNNHVCTIGFADAIPVRSRRLHSRSLLNFNGRRNGVGRGARS